MPLVSCEYRTRVPSGEIEVRQRYRQRACVRTGPVLTLVADTLNQLTWDDPLSSLPVAAGLMRLLGHPGTGMKLDTKKRSPFHPPMHGTQRPAYSDIEVHDASPAILTFALRSIWVPRFPISAQEAYYLPQLRHAFQ